MPELSGPEAVDQLRRADADLERAEDLAGNLAVVFMRSGDNAMAQQIKAVQQPLVAAWRRVRSVLGAEVAEAPEYSLEPATVAGEALGRVGAPGSVPVGFAGDLDLSTLSQMQELGPDMAALAGHLRAALEVAERVDEARGRCLPEPVGGTRGTDLAEEVYQLLCMVENQMLGTPGKGWE